MCFGDDYRESGNSADDRRQCRVACDVFGVVLETSSRAICFVSNLCDCIIIFFS